MSTFLAKWANAAPKQPAGKPSLPVPTVACEVLVAGGEKGITPDAHTSSPTATDCENEPGLVISGLERAVWKAAALNRLFQEQGTIGEPGRLTAATVRHGGETDPKKSSAKVAVVCDTNLGTRPAQLDRIDLCAQCGGSEWRWVGGAWVCSGCGRPPRRPAPNTASLKVDSLTTNERPMS